MARPFRRLALCIFAVGHASFARSEECPRQTPRVDALRAVVVAAGEDDAGVLAEVAGLGANTLVTTTPPRRSTALAAAAAGLRYIAQVSTQEVQALYRDPGRAARWRAMPGLGGFHYLDESVLEGYATPLTQERTYGILKELFPHLFAVYATRLDPITWDAGYLDAYYRPEFTDLVTPYFYPVGSTVLGPHQDHDSWERTLRSLLAPLAARTPADKPVLPVLQAFEQPGYPAGGALPLRQLQVYREFWPEADNAAAFWWGGGLDETLLGFSEHPMLTRGVRQLFGSTPARAAPCGLLPRSPIQSRP
jgi:hypothetical protein